MVKLPKAKTLFGNLITSTISQVCRQEAID